MLTATAMPTPVPPWVLIAAPPAMFWISLRSLAATVTLPAVAVRCVTAPLLLATVAWVSRST